MAILTQHVGVGMIRATAGPSVLRATVGPGFLICLLRCDGQLAGAVHIPSEACSVSGDGKLLGIWVHNLLAAMPVAAGDRHSIRAEIIGGADLARVLPAHAHARLVETAQRAVRDHLNAAGIVQIICRAVGGHSARAVAITLPGGRVEINPVAAAQPVDASNMQQPSRRPWSPEDAPHTVPRTVVNMGCVEVVRCPALLVAILGSCVGVALYDPDVGVGGLAHVMLPARGDRQDQPLKYADRAIPHLIEEMQALGAKPARMGAKLAGGANVFNGWGHGQPFSIGKENISSSKRQLATARIKVRSESLGGSSGRKMKVHLPEFRVQIKLLGAEPLGEGA